MRAVLFKIDFSTEWDIIYNCFSNTKELKSLKKFQVSNKVVKYRVLDAVAVPIHASGVLVCVLAYIDHTIALIILEVVSHLVLEFQTKLSNFRYLIPDMTLYIATIYNSF